MAILEHRSDNVEINGEVCESGFNIMASAEAFEILSDRIYPNKIKAVIRELSTNAVDATIDASKVSRIHYMLNSGPCTNLELALAVNDNDLYVERERKTFYETENYDLSNWTEKAPVVHLPNKIEPWFSVRDYGTGLSHDFIMKLYTTYFWSDKKTSNDYTGCLGLGSKSPFAYTDHFTVTSYFNGEKRMYNAHLRNGFPSISIFLDDDGNPLVYETDESNGLEISFSVKSVDIYSFEHEARQLYPYFRFPIKIIGNTEVNDYINHVQQKDNFYKLYSNETIEWGIRKNNDGDHGPRAIMGNIAYPIKLNSYKYSGIITKLLQSNLDIVFPVGALQITPSREQLSYKDSTIKTIEDTLEKVASELVNKIDDQIQSASNLWEARCLTNKMINNGEFGGFLPPSFKLKWNGHDFANTNYVRCNEIKGITIFKYDRKKTEVYSIPCHSNIIIYKNDLSKGNISRMLVFARNNTGKSIFSITFDNKKAEDDFIQHLGMPANTKFPGTSSLPKPDVKDRVSYISNDKIYKHSGRLISYGNKQYKFWEPAGKEFDLSEGGIYVEMNRYKAYINGKEYHPSKIGSILSLIENIENNKPVLIGVRKQMIKQFSKSDDWVELSVYAKNLIKNKFDNNNIGVHTANRKVAGKFSNFSNFSKLSNCIIDKINSGILKDYLTKVNELDNSFRVHFDEQPYNSLASYIGYIIDEYKPSHTLTNDEQVKLFERYSLLSVFLRTSLVNPKEIDGVVQYINSIDKK